MKDLNKLDYCIAGVPWDGGTTNRPGARHGPREIRNASSLVRLYHPVSLKSPYDKFNIVPMCVECNNWGQELEFKEYRDLVFRPIIKNK